MKKQRQERGPLKLTSLNHISLVCRSLEKTLDFYQNVLGFFPIRRPDFDFDGAWLFNYGIGVHLLQTEDPGSIPEAAGPINIKANHVSFQCESMAGVEKALREMGIEFERSRVEEGGIFVDQLFFHDPDGIMIEICNCDNLPVEPLVGEGDAKAQSCSSLSCNVVQQKKQQQQQQMIQKKHSMSGFPSMEELLPGMA